MKILIPTLEYPPQIGGIAQYIINQIEHWPKADDSFVIVATKDREDKEYDQANKWPVIRLALYYKYFWPRWLKMCWQVGKIIKREKVDKIFVHHILPVGYIAWWNKKLRNIPYYIFFHGRDLGMAFENKPRQAKLVCRGANKIIVNSEFIKNKLIGYLPEIKNKIQVVYPCSSFSDDSMDKTKLDVANKLKQDRNFPVMLTVSRFVKRKGIDDSILAFKKVLEKVPSALYIIIGTGPEKEHLQELIKENKLEKNIQILEVNRSNLPYYYQLADLFILTPKELPNGDVEGFGIVYLEASQFGLPIVATKTGGVSEAVLDQKTGLLCEAGSIEQISKAITKLLLDKKLARQLGEQGRDRVKNEFEWEKQLKKILI